MYRAVGKQGSNEMLSWLNEWMNENFINFRFLYMDWESSNFGSVTVLILLNLIFVYLGIKTCYFWFVYYLNNAFFLLTFSN